MIIFVKQYTGRTVTLSVSSPVMLKDITDQLFRLRSSLHDDHPKYLMYIYNGKTLDNNEPPKERCMRHIMRTMINYLLLIKSH